ncbi:hypothetical protein PWT90_02698 [Aphanocladium album]|nr:hypothetical protein PWT90_02698 [Aphanocladium album]
MKFAGPLTAAVLGAVARASCAGNSKPNFIFIMTDDQDQQLGSLEYMPSVKKHVKKEGGYPKFISQGLNDNYLPVWLQDAGYNTYYTGKLMNAYGTRTYQNPAPRVLLDPNTYVYNDAIFTLDNQPFERFTGEYSTDLIAKRSLEFLKQGIDAKKPFFLGVAPIAPHSELTDTFREPVPADRHQDFFPDAQVPRNKNFNPAQAGSASYFKQLPRLDDSQVQYLDNFQRRRVQALQAVDELVNGIFQALEAHPDVLANTYIIYTADNGFHLGQHRLPAGKTCGIEEDVNVPFLVRGPGVAKNKALSFPSSHTDLAPTFLKLAGIPLRNDFDGLPIPVRAVDQTPEAIKTEHVSIEFWGKGIIEGTAFGNLRAGGYFDQNTYKTLRIVSDQHELAYTVWCNGDHELYNMKRDLYQSFNLYGKQPQGSPYNISQLTKRLDTLVLTLKNCKGDSCRHPWRMIFPSGKVKSLQDALDSTYDSFFASQPCVSFDECTLGYLPELEGPASPNPYQGYLARDADILDEHWI